MSGLFAMTSYRFQVTLPAADCDTGICRETLQRMCQTLGKDEATVTNLALALTARILFPTYDPNDRGPFTAEELAAIQQQAGPVDMVVVKSLFKP